MKCKSFLFIAIICLSFVACSNNTSKGNKPLTEQELRQELEKEQTRLLGEITGKWATNKLSDSGYGHYLEMTIDRGQNVACRAIDARDGEKLASIYGTYYSCHAWKFV